MNKKNILIVDDEKNIRDFVGRNLQARQFDVLSASTGLEALALFKENPLDLIILDIMMPMMDGLEVCRRIRQESTVPILALTALGEEDDKVRALNMGVDDYLTKPFGIEELLARIHSIMRRVNWEREQATSESLQYDDITLIPANMSVKVNLQEIAFTRTEFNLLHYFMQNKGKVLSHRDILQNVWGEAYSDEAEYLRVYIGRLRRKIESDPNNPKYLKTEYGFGYRFG
jgi:two-component system KDP operon response regulator KdpE